MPAFVTQINLNNAAKVKSGFAGIKREILIQGDRGKELLQILEKKGYKAKISGG